MEKSQKIRSTNSGSLRLTPRKKPLQTKIKCNVMNIVNLLSQKLAERKEVKLFIACELQLEIWRENKGKSVVMIIS